MANYILTLEGYDDVHGVIEIVEQTTPTDPPPPTTVPKLKRVLHDLEMVRLGLIPSLWRPNLPEVHPLFPNQFSWFDKSWQLVAKAMNPKISKKQWTKVYGPTLWISNGQGFGTKGDPRANFVLGENIKAKLPKVEALVTGGTVLAGKYSFSMVEAIKTFVRAAQSIRAGRMSFMQVQRIVADTLAKENMWSVATLDYHNAPPPAAWFEKNWWFRVPAVSVDGKGTPRRFPQGQLPDGTIATIYHPMLADPGRFPEITIPLWKLVDWNEPTPPDPFKLYF